MQAGPCRPLLPGCSARGPAEDLRARRELLVHGLAQGGPGGRVPAAGPGLQDRGGGGGGAEGPDAEPRPAAAAAPWPPKEGDRERGREELSAAKVHAPSSASGDDQGPAKKRLCFPSLRCYCRPRS